MAHYTNPGVSDLVTQTMILSFRVVSCRVASFRVWLGRQSIGDWTMNWKSGTRRGAINRWYERAKTDLQPHRRALEATRHRRRTPRHPPASPPRLSASVTPSAQGHSRGWREEAEGERSQVKQTFRTTRNLGWGDDVANVTRDFFYVSTRPGSDDVGSYR